MADIMTLDSSSDPQIVGAQEADEAESLAIGQELQAQHEAGKYAGKFNDPGELEAAYLELQKKLGSREEGQEEQVEQQEERAADPQLDYLLAANEEFLENGELSAETLEGFANMSSKELVEAYFRMQNEMPDEPTYAEGRELTANEVNSIQNSVGGEAAYAQMTQWAAENFSAEEIQAFDDLMGTGNTAAIGLAVQALKTRYQDANGYEGEMLTGKPAQSSSGFRSQAELVEAMSDPRYELDEAYRDEVMRRVSRSNLFNK